MLIYSSSRLFIQFWQELSHGRRGALWTEGARLSCGIYRVDIFEHLVSVVKAKSVTHGYSAYSFADEKRELGNIGEVVLF